MDLTSPKIIKNLLKQRQIFPSRRLGQNFLIDKSVLSKIIKAANLKPNDIVLEIGPGLGTLTQELAKRVKKVVAIEKDQKMVEILKETIKSFKNVKISQGDVLKSNIQHLISNTKYKVVANLPYYIVSPVIRKFLEQKKPPKLMVLMVQEEVAQRICASPAKVFAKQKFRRASRPKMNLLAVSVQFYAKPKIISFVSKKSFWPQPKVDSAILKISAFNQRRKSAFNRRFFKIVKAGFSQPRKQLANNFSKGLALSLPNGLKLNKEKTKTWLLKNKISPERRAETLSLKDWTLLTQSFDVLK